MIQQIFKTTLEWCYSENKEQLGSGENEEAGEHGALSRLKPLGLAVSAFALLEALRN